MRLQNLLRLISIGLVATSLALTSCDDDTPIKGKEKPEVPEVPKEPEKPKAEIVDGKLIKFPTELLKDGEAILPEEVVTIGEEAFDRVAELKKVTGPKVVTIEARAFANITALEEVILPEVTTIKDNAFQKATALKVVNFPKVETIGNFAFSEATALEEAHFPMIKNIGNNAFAGAKALIKVEIGATAPTMGDEDPFKDTSKEKDLLMPQVYDYETMAPWAVKYGFHSINGDKIADVVAPPAGMEAEGRKITKVTDNSVLNNPIVIPEYFNEIGEKAFYRKRGTSFGSFTANGVIRLGASALENAINLWKVEMLSLKYIGERAFKNNKYMLTKLEKIPNVVEIGDNAFEECESLELVKLPNVKKIGKDIFKWCTKMEKFGTLHLGATPPEVDGGFGIPHIPTLVVPKGAKANYDNWEYKGVFGEIIEEGGSGIEVGTE